MAGSILAPTWAELRQHQPLHSKSCFPRAGMAGREARSAPQLGLSAGFEGLEVLGAPRLSLKGGTHEGILSSHSDWLGWGEGDRRGPQRDPQNIQPPSAESLCWTPPGGHFQSPRPPHCKPDPLDLGSGLQGGGPSVGSPLPPVARQDTGQATGIGGGRRWDTGAGRGLGRAPGGRPPPLRTPPRSRRTRVWGRSVYW